MASTLATMTADGTTFKDLKLQELVDRAGVSRTMFYVYFDTKADLLTACLKDAFADLGRPVAALKTLAELRRADIHCSLSRLVTEYRARGNMFRLAYEAAAYEPSIRTLLDRSRDDVVEQVSCVLSTGQQRDGINPDLDADEAAWWLVRMTARGLSQIVGPAPNAELPAIVNAWTDIVWRTLRPAERL